MRLVEEEEAESAVAAVEDDELQVSSSSVLGMGPVRAMVETEELARPSSSSASVRTDPASEDLVSCVFTWTHGGHEVYLTGSFNDWSERVKMVKAGHEFVTALELPRGRHSYKFVVDDIWKFAPDQETATDEHGFVNNVIDISDHQHFRCVDLQPTLKDLTFSQDIPDPTEYTSDAPAIPLLFSKVQCPATHPPPPLIAPLHGLANHIYHDSSVSTAIGPHTSAISMVFRQPADHRQCYVVAIHATVSPLAKNALSDKAGVSLIPTNAFRTFAESHFVV